MNFTGNNKPLVLVHKTMSSVKGNEAFDIMLSPQFYTMKKEDLSLRYSYQAKKLAPSVLEDLLSPDKYFMYYAFKEGDSWVFIAYDPEEISRFLKSRGAAVESISKLYFAQQVVEKFTTPVLLNKDEVISNIQHIATVTPKVLLSERVQCQGFSDAFRPSSGVSFVAGSKSIIEKKDALIISAIFLLFGLMYVAEGIRYQKVIGAMEEKVVDLFKEYPSLKNQYSRENIAQKYQKIDKEERHKREILKELSRLVLPGVEVENLSMNGKHFSFLLKYPNKKTADSIESRAKGKHYKLSKSDDKKQIRVEGKI